MQRPRTLWASMVTAALLCGVAGPVRAQDATAEPGAEAHPVVEGPTARVELLGREGLSLHRLVEHGGLTEHGLRDDRYEAICRAPCEAEVPIGALELAVSGDGAVATPVAGTMLSLSPGSRVRLELSHESLEPVRTAGWVILVAGVLGGLATVSGTLFSPGDSDTLLAVGLGVGGFGVVLGLPLTLAADRAGVRVLADLGRALAGGVRF